MSSSGKWEDVSSNYIYELDLSRMIPEEIAKNKTVDIDILLKFVFNFLRTTDLVPEISYKKIVKVRKKLVVSGDDMYYSTLSDDENQEQKNIFFVANDSADPDSSSNYFMQADGFVLGKIEPIEKTPSRVRITILEAVKNTKEYFEKVILSMIMFNPDFFKLAYKESNKISKLYMPELFINTEIFRTVLMLGVVKNTEIEDDTKNTIFINESAIINSKERITFFVPMSPEKVMKCEIFSTYVDGVKKSEQTGLRLGTLYTYIKCSNIIESEKEKIEKVVDSIGLECRKRSVQLKKIFKGYGVVVDTDGKEIKKEIEKFMKKQKKNTIYTGKATYCVAERRAIIVGEQKSQERIDQEYKTEIEKDKKKFKSRFMDYELDGKNVRLMCDNAKYPYIGYTKHGFPCCYSTKYNADQVTSKAMSANVQKKTNKPLTLRETPLNREPTDLKGEIPGQLRDLFNVYSSTESPPSFVRLSTFTDESSLLECLKRFKGEELKSKRQVEEYRKNLIVSAADYGYGQQQFVGVPIEKVQSIVKEPTVFLDSAPFHDYLERLFGVLIIVIEASPIKNDASIGKFIKPFSKRGYRRSVSDETEKVCILYKTSSNDRSQYSLIAIDNNNKYSMIEDEKLLTKIRELYFNDVMTNYYGINFSDFPTKNLKVSKQYIDSNGKCRGIVVDMSDFGGDQLYLSIFFDSWIIPLAVQPIEKNSIIYTGKDSKLFKKLFSKETKKNPKPIIVNSNIIGYSLKLYNRNVIMYIDNPIPISYKGEGKPQETTLKLPFIDPEFLNYTDRFNKLKIMSDNLVQKYLWFRSNYSQESWENFEKRLIPTEDYQEKNKNKDLYIYPYKKIPRSMKIPSVKSKTLLKNIEAANPQSITEYKNLLFNPKSFDSVTSYKKYNGTVILDERYDSLKISPVPLYPLYTSLPDKDEQVDKLMLYVPLHKKVYRLHKINTIPPSLENYTLYTMLVDPITGVTWEETVASGERNVYFSDNKGMYYESIP